MSNNQYNSISCMTEQLAVIPNKNNATNMSGMVMLNGITYCVKSKSHTAGVTDVSTLYKFDDCEISDFTSLKIENCISYGLAYNSYTDKLYIAADGKKIFAKGIDSSSLSVYTVHESDVQAITYYKSNQMILMGNDLNTADYLYFMIGKLSSGSFNISDSFYVVRNGYNKLQDIYYNDSNGLFIITNDSSSSYSSCLNRILRSSMQTIVGTYNGKNVYGIDEILDVNFDTTIYQQCNVESMSLDKYGHPILVCNTKIADIGTDIFFRITNQTYLLKTITEFSCNSQKSITVPNYQPAGFPGKVSFLSGMTMNNNAAYFVKNNATLNKSAIYIYPNYSTTSYTVYGLEGDGLSYGMAYYNNSLFIAYRNEIRKYNLTGSLLKSYNTNGLKIEAITHLREMEFLVMQNSLINGKLSFRIWNLSGNTILEKGWFYVDDLGYDRLQDIYYHPDHGLFISTNPQVLTTCKNYILRVDLTYYLKELDSGRNMEQYLVPCASRWVLNLSTSDYTQCNTESLSISPSGELLVCCNVVQSDSPSTECLTTDGVLKITNFAFRTNGIGIFTSQEKMLDIPLPGLVPGCLAINGRKIYCITTDTNTAANTSCFMNTSDYRNVPFISNPNIIHDLGHCNGGTYHHNILYSCDYIRSSIPQKEIGLFLLDGDYSELDTTKKRVTTSTLYGAISYYRDQKFLLINYESNDGIPYSGLINIDLCSFHENNGIYTFAVETEKYVTVQNPLYPHISGASSVLQDAHYEPGFGLCIAGYITVSGEKTFYIMRVDIDQYLDKNEHLSLSPNEVYLPLYNGTKREIESMVITEYGELLVSNNFFGTATDILGKVINIKFNREL